MLTDMSESTVVTSATAGAEDPDRDQPEKKRAKRGNSRDFLNEPEDMTAKMMPLAMLKQNSGSGARKQTRSSKVVGIHRDRNFIDDVVLGIRHTASCYCCDPLENKRLHKIWPLIFNLCLQFLWVGEVTIKDKKGAKCFKTWSSLRMRLWGQKIKTLLDNVFTAVSFEFRKLIVKSSA